MKNMITHKYSSRKNCCENKMVELNKNMAAVKFFANNLTYVRPFYLMSWNQQVIAFKSYYYFQNIFKALNFALEITYLGFECRCNSEKELKLISFESIF